MWAIGSVAGSLDGPASGKGVATAEGAKGLVAAGFCCGLVASCWDAVTSRQRRDGRCSVGLTAAVVAGVCCCEKPKPNMSREGTAAQSQG
jgi:hypothetical protein